jgi:Uma2 family endonuclease
MWTAQSRSGLLGKTTTRHGRRQLFSGSNYRQKGQIRVRPELRVQVAPTRLRIPDVTLLDRNLPQEPVATRPPVAVFEILSPEDTLRKVMTRCADYERMGIHTILVIDPQGPKYRYLAGRLEPLEPRTFPGLFAALYS